MFLPVDITHFHTLIKKLLQQEAAAEREAGDGEEAETTTDVPENVSIRIYSSSSWRQSLLIFFHSEEAKMMYVFDVV